MPLSENKIFKPLFSFLENSSSLYLVSFDAEDNFTYVNKLYKNHFAHIYNQFVGEKITKDMANESLQLFNSCKVKGWANLKDNTAIEIRKKGKDPNIDIYIKWDFFPIEMENNIIKEIGGIGYCVTEHSNEKEMLKTTKLRLQMALSSVEEAYFFIDKNFKILSYNHRAKASTLQYFGITLYEGFDFRKFIAPGTEDDFYKDFSNAINGGVVSTDLIANYPNGEKIWYRITMKPFIDEDEKILGVILSSINIDDVKRKEERLKEIAWHQSHKVRKPLSNILGIVNLLRDEKNNLKDPDLINMLEESAKELDTVIKETIAKTL